MTSMRPISRVAASTPQGASGVLAAERRNYLFTYHSDALDASALSLLMPVRAAQYEFPQLHPIFQMNMPEGYVLEQLRLRFAKTTAFDPLLLLALTGRSAPIGRVRVETDVELPNEASGAAKGVHLSEILTWDGAESIFNALAERYLLRSGVSGVQPKLLVPEAVEATKTSIATPELIVKSGGDEYPGLAVNEYICMSIARQAGIPVPDFYLSNNAELFVMRRFDRDAKGNQLGFEDMAALSGRGTAQKYEGSYEQIAKIIRLFCAEEAQRAGLEQLFDQVALSCMIGNGDAHLKNFGLIYTDPGTNDARLAPAYDIVCTTAYIQHDSLALSLGGSKSMFAARVNLIDFAERLKIERPKQRIERMLDAASDTLAREVDLLAFYPDLNASIRSAINAFTQ